MMPSSQRISARRIRRLLMVLAILSCAGTGVSSSSDSTCSSTAASQSGASLWTLYACHCPLHCWQRMPLPCGSGATPFV